MKVCEYVGNIHVHSRYSDGTGKIKEIARAAQAAGLDFVIVTDHRTLAGRAEEGYYGKLLLLVGEELGEKTGHYLGLGIEAVSAATGPREMIEAVAAQGGVGIIAHPDDRRFPWPDWTVTGYDGLSLWNFTSQWRWSLRGWRWLVYPLFPGLAITSPPAAVRQRWDELNLPRKDRLIAAIGASDAHAFGWRPLGLPLVILPYRLLFRAINTHVLLETPLCGQPKEDERLILDALRRGASFVANDLHRPARGFRFWAEGEDGPRGMGSILPAGSVRRLRVKLPSPGWMVLLRDGRPVRTAFERSLTLEAPPPGLYRVEVYRDAKAKRGWIFSNPIRLRA
ncbi:MAG: PHP domain-containing protein [Bacillota bacterium]